MSSWARTYDKAFDLDDTSHFIGILKQKGLFGGFKLAGLGKVAGWGNGPKKSILWITNQMDFGWGDKDWFFDRPNGINPHNGFSHYLIFSNYSTAQIQDLIKKNHFQTLAQLVGYLKGTLVRLGPDALELIDSQTPAQKGRSQDETPQSRDKNRQEPTDQDLKDIGLTRAEFEALNTAFTDPAMIANMRHVLLN